MTTMLLIGMLMAGGLMQKNQPMPQPVQVSFPSGKISVLTARQEEGWLTVNRTWLIPRESDEPLRLRLTGIWQLEETPAGLQAVSLGLCAAGGFFREGEALQEFHVSDTTGSYPGQKVSAQAGLAGPAR